MHSPSIIEETSVESYKLDLVKQQVNIGTECRC